MGILDLGLLKFLGQLGNVRESKLEAQRGRTWLPQLSSADYSNAKDENTSTEPDIGRVYCGDSWVREQSARTSQISTSNSCLNMFLQAFLNLWTKRTTVTGLDYLMDALKEENRDGRGVMTSKSRLPQIHEKINVH